MFDRFLNAPLKSLCSLVEREGKTENYLSLFFIEGVIISFIFWERFFGTHTGQPV